MRRRGSAIPFSAYEALSVPELRRLGVGVWQAPSIPRLTGLLEAWIGCVPAPGRPRGHLEASLVRCPTEFRIDPFVDPSSAYAEPESDGSDGLPAAIPRHQNGVTNRHKIHV